MYLPSSKVIESLQKYCYFRRISWHMYSILNKAETDGPTCLAGQHYMNIHNIDKSECIDYKRTSIGSKEIF